MAGPIKVRKRTYRPWSEMAPPAGVAAPGAPAWRFPGPVEDRGFLSPKKKVIGLKKTYGLYMALGGRNILLVVDGAAAVPGSAAWAFIHKVAGQLAAAYPGLDADAKQALAMLDAVIFAASPSRSFAQVEKATFFSDTDEFQRADKSWITPAYSASCIVHDANHVRIHKKGGKHWGEAAEIACWKLQVANAAPLGLAAFEVDFLKDLIAHPEKAKTRMEEPPF